MLITAKYVYSCRTPWTTCKHPPLGDCIWRLAYLQRPLASYCSHWRVIEGAPGVYGSNTRRVLSCTAGGKQTLSCRWSAYSVFFLQENRSASERKDATSAPTLRLLHISWLVGTRDYRVFVMVRVLLVSCISLFLIFCLLNMCTFACEPW